MCFGASASNCAVSSLPKPRRGGLTNTNSGALIWLCENLAESSAAKLRLSIPIICAERCALAIASGSISMPVTAVSGAAQCSAKPPTPQNRSHICVGAISRTQARAVAYSCSATLGLVWKKLFGRITIGTSLNCSSKLCVSVRKISSSPSRRAICTGWILTEMTSIIGKAAVNIGKLRSIRSSTAWLRATKRSINWPLFSLWVSRINFSSPFFFSLL